MSYNSLRGSEAAALPSESVTLMRLFEEAGQNSNVPPVILAAIAVEKQVSCLSLKCRKRGEPHCWGHGDTFKSFCWHDPKGTGVESLELQSLPIVDRVRAAAAWLGSMSTVLGFRVGEFNGGLCRITDRCPPAVSAKAHQSPYPWGQGRSAGWERIYF